jgi:hypothetical protein
MVSDPCLLTSDIWHVSCLYFLNLFFGAHHEAVFCCSGDLVVGVFGDSADQRASADDGEAGVPPGATSRKRQHFSEYIGASLV